MSCMPVRVVGPSLIAVLAMGPALAVGSEVEPTVFEKTISSWMGVVALLAADGDGPSTEGSARDAERPDSEREQRSDRAGRGGRGPREWSRDRGPAPRGPGMWMPAPPPGGPSMPGMRPDAAAKLDDIVARLSRIERKLDAAPSSGNPWSPRPEAGRRPGFAGPGFGGSREMPEEMRREMERRRDEMRKRMEEARARGGEPGRGLRPQAPAAALPPEMQERIKGMMEEGRKRMAEAQEKMEQARRRFAEMEERITKLEAEIERLKAGK